MCTVIFWTRNTGCRYLRYEDRQEFVSVLEDNVRFRGAMSQLTSDRALADIGGKVKDIHIDDWQSEPHHQHENFAERHYSTIKSYTNVIMNRTGAPAYTWLLCLQYVAYIYNHISCKSLGAHLCSFSQVRLPILASFCNSLSGRTFSIPTSTVVFHLNPLKNVVILLVLPRMLRI
jgi:hypothetical protein